MNSILLAIDPGNHAGWATFDIITKQLLQCGLCHHPSCLPTGSYDTLIIERPHEHKTEKAPVRDIITLAITAGRYIQQAGARRTRVVEPFEWKRQVPKPIHNARVVAELSSANRKVYDGCIRHVATSEQNNTIDAVGLGLWFFEHPRFGGYWL